MLFSEVVSKLGNSQHHLLARRHQNYVVDIYPIVIFSFNQPYRAESNTLKIEFSTLKVLEFCFHAIQLNRLN
jgi:hypothetical protein